MTIPASWKTILHRPEKGRPAIAIASALFTVLLALLYLYQPVFFRFLDGKSYDTILMSIPPDTIGTSDTPVIIDIDEKSLAKYGQWPWPRYRVALLLDKLIALGPASIGLDTVFAEPDRTSFAVLKKDIYRDLNITVPTEHMPFALMDNDKTLATTLARGPCVLGYKFTFSDSEQKSSLNDCLLHPLNVAVIRDDGAAASRGHVLFQAHDVICNLRPLAENAVSSGFFNVIPDDDGVLRRVPLLILHDGKTYPSLALATLIQAKGIKQAYLKITSGGVESLHLSNTEIPLDAKGNLLIHYRGKGKTFQYLSAADLLEGVVKKNQIQGRIVLLGASAAGITDFHTTPFDTVFPGVEVHATVIDNILKKDFFSRPSWIPGLELMLGGCPRIANSARQT